MKRQNGIIVLEAKSLPMIYGPDELRDIADLVDLVAPPLTREMIYADPSPLQDVDVLFSGWGPPLVDAQFLTHSPRLQAIFYGAGSTSSIITDSVWDRGITVSSAYGANALPVAEYTLAAILMSLRHAWHLAHQMRREKCLVDREGMPGGYGSRVGLISMGAIGRRVLELLRPFDLRIAVYDPFLTRPMADSLGVELLSLEEIFRSCDVVSLHSPLLKETEGMIGSEHFRMMKTGAAFINTARGELIRENEMLEVLAQRPDLQAILDVTVCEAEATDSPLYTLPNVFVTPHISGSSGPECRRMGRFMVDECRRYLQGEPLQWQITRELAERSSHRPMQSRTKLYMPAKIPRVSTGNNVWVSPELRASAGGAPIVANGAD
ncbi:hydroxyacid dehydrogenase [soil metagenome]